LDYLTAPSLAKVKYGRMLWNEYTMNWKKCGRERIWNKKKRLTIAASYSKERKRR